jgi:hypothetical protein
MKYENYYYLDSKVKFEGNLYRIDKLPEPFQILPSFRRDGVDIWHLRDDGLCEEVCPNIYIDLSSDSFEQNISNPRSQVIKFNKISSQGSIRLYDGYTAASEGGYSRPIEFYKVRLKRRKDETWFFIEGQTGLLDPKTIRNIKDIAIIEELGALQFSIWFNLRDNRIKDVFSNESYRHAYERLLASPIFNPF